MWCIQTRAMKVRVTRLCGEEETAAIVLVIAVQRHLHRAKVHICMPVDVLADGHASAQPDPLAPITIAIGARERPMQRLHRVTSDERLQLVMLEYQLQVVHRVCVGKRGVRTVEVLNQHAAGFDGKQRREDVECRFGFSANLCDEIERDLGAVLALVASGGRREQV